MKFAETASIVYNYGITTLQKHDTITWSHLVTGLRGLHDTPHRLMLIGEALLQTP